MHLIKVCFILLFLSGQYFLSGQINISKIPSVSIDTIQYLKKKSQTLLIENRYEELYKIFSFVADYYLDNSNKRMYFDYKNKAVNCYSKYSEQSSSLDTVFLLYKNYDASNLNDTAISAAIIRNLIDNHTNTSDYPVKLKYIDFLINSTKSPIPHTSRIQLVKDRISITKKLSFIDKELISYYDLLNQNPSCKDEIEYGIDLGILYSDIKEYHLSNITLQNILGKKEIKNTDKAVIYNILGSNYLNINKYSLSYYFYHESLSLRNNIENNAGYLRVIYNNLGNYYYLINNIDSARILYNQSLEISKKEFGITSRESAFEYNNLGNHYYNIGKFDSALLFYQKSFDIKQSIPGYSDIDIIHSLYNLGLTQSKLGNILDAITWLHQSVLKNFQLAKTYSLKNGLSSPNDYIFSCKNLGEVYYNIFTQFQEISFLDSAKSYFFKAIAANDSIIYSTPIESSKILINLANSKIVESYLQCFLNENIAGNYPVLDTAKVLSLFDKCHNYVLLNKLIGTTNNSQSVANIVIDGNPILLDVSYSAIEFLEDDRSSDLNKLFELSSNLFTKIKNLPTSDMKYQDSYKLENQETSFSKLNRIIDNQTIILEYTAVKDILYCLSITNKDIRISKIGNVQELQKLINKCGLDFVRFSIDFNQLYELSKILLHPLKSISASFNRIIIIKDENLLKIPFDALLLSQPKINYQNNNYLIKSHDISYSYSVSIILQNSTDSARNDVFDFVGFAPMSTNESNNDSPDKLAGSLDEINTISKLFSIANHKSYAFLGHEANIENFYKFAAVTKILHIATHSSISPGSKNVAFLLNSETDGLFHALNYYDVLTLTKSPNLVILATCSSNSGRIIEGEGIQNLGRAFSTKGTSFIISSLFRLDDQFSNKFMTLFYNKLLPTNNVIGSLSESKREFISDKTYSYPTYWTNFNLIGQ